MAERWKRVTLLGSWSALVSSEGARVVAVQSDEEAVSLLTGLQKTAERWQVVSTPAFDFDPAVIQVDISALNGILRISRKGCYAVVGAAASVAAIETAARHEGFTLGPLSDGCRRGTVHDMLSSDYIPRPSPRYGAVRDMVLSLTAATATGLTRCALAPRRSMGPDLARCMMTPRARGVILTECVLQLWPLETMQISVRLEFGERGRLLEAINSIQARGLQPDYWQGERVGSVWQLTGTFSSSCLVKDVETYLRACFPAVERIERVPYERPSERPSWFEAGTWEGQPAFDFKPGAVLCVGRLDTGADDEWRALAAKFEEHLAAGEGAR